METRRKRKASIPPPQRETQATTKRGRSSTGSAAKSTTSGARAEEKDCRVVAHQASGSPTDAPSAGVSTRAAVRLGLRPPPDPVASPPRLRAAAARRKAHSSAHRRDTTMSDRSRPRERGNRSDEQDREADPARSALQGLLKKLGAGFEDLIPMTVGPSSSRTKTILAQLRSDEESQQIEALTQLNDLLSYGSEDTLGSFPVEQAVPILVEMMQACEHNPDMMLLAARSLTYLADIVPSSCASIVRHHGISAFCQRLLTVEYIDVAEQSLQALEKLSYEHAGSCLQNGGLMAVLSFIDFFPTGVQRVALHTAANMCRGITTQHVSAVQEAIPILINMLSYHDSKLVDSACLSLGRIVEFLAERPEYRSIVSSSGLVQEALSLLQAQEAGSSASQVSTQTFYGMVKLLSLCTKGSGTVAKTLLTSGVSGTLRTLLAGYAHDAGSLQVGGRSTPNTPRTGAQLQDLVALACHLLPRIPPVEQLLQEGCSPMKVLDANMTAEKDTGSESAGELSQPLLQRYSHDLLHTLLQLVNSSIVSSIRVKTLSAVTKILYFNEADFLEAELETIQIAGFIASLLGARDSSLVAYGMVLSELLMHRLPDKFQVLFVKEGVLHSIIKLAASSPASDGPAPAHREDRGDGAAAGADAPSGAGTPRWRTRRAACLRSAIGRRAVLFKDAYFSSAVKMETEGLRLMQDLAQRLPSDRSAFQQIFATLASDQGKDISTFELHRSGVVKALIDHLTGADLKESGSEEPAQLALVERLCAAVEVALPPGSGCQPPLGLLVERLLAVLATMEAFPIVSSSAVTAAASSSRSLLARSSSSRRAHSNNSAGDNGFMAGLSVLAQPLRLRLRRAETETQLKDYSSNVVLIEPLASMNAIEEFLWPRVCRNSIRDGAQKEHVRAAGRASAADRATAGGVGTSKGEPSARRKVPGLAERLAGARLKDAEASASREAAQEQASVMMTRQQHTGQGSTADAADGSKPPPFATLLLGSRRSRSSAAPAESMRVTRSQAATEEAAAADAAAEPGTSKKGATEAPGTGWSADRAGTSAGEGAVCTSKGSRSRRSGGGGPRLLLGSSGSRSGEEAEVAEVGEPDEDVIEDDEMILLHGLLNEEDEGEEMDEDDDEDLFEHDDDPVDGLSYPMPVHELHQDSGSAAPGRQAQAPGRAAGEDSPAPAQAPAKQGHTPEQRRGQQELSPSARQEPGAGGEGGGNSGSGRGHAADRSRGGGAGGTAPPGEGSYAQAAGGSGAGEPTRQLVFSVDGQQLSHNSTIFQVVQQLLVRNALNSMDEPGGFPPKHIRSMLGTRYTPAPVGLQSGPPSVVDLKGSGATVPAAPEGRSTDDQPSSSSAGGSDAPFTRWGDVFTLTYALARKDGGSTAASHKAEVAGQEAAPSSGGGESGGTESGSALKRIAESPLGELLSSEVPDSQHGGAGIGELLHLLRILEALNRLAPRLVHHASASLCSSGSSHRLPVGSLPRQAFISGKLGNKLGTQLKDVLSICGNSLPPWCAHLTSSCHFLFPFETRRRYLYCTAFSLARALNFMQQLHASEGNSAVVPESAQDLRVGRLQRQKVRVARSRILESGAKVMDLYACSRAVLEIEYFGEPGTGLGPTLEFYTLLSHELQRKSQGMWRHEPQQLQPPRGFGTDAASRMESDLPQDKRDEFVNAPFGLFPRPLPPQLRDSKEGKKVLDSFRLLGRTVAKAFQDFRLLDLPLSTLFFRMVLARPVDLLDVRSMDPAFGASLEQLHRALLAWEAGGRNGPLLVNGCPLADLALEFSLPGMPEYVLEGGTGIDGSVVEVTDDNLEAYIDQVVDAMLGSGVELQIKAFVSAFNEVFDINTLQCFFEDEIEGLLCGVAESWSAEMLVECLKFDHGYNSNSPPVKDFLAVISELDGADQRRFLRFVTGCPRLPPGGVASLQPRLTVVRKHSSGGQGSGVGGGEVSPGTTPRSLGRESSLPSADDGDLPSVMTCANYIKLPAYSSREVMRERLLFAIREGQASFDLS